MKIIISMKPYQYSAIENLLSRIVQYYEDEKLRGETIENFIQNNMTPDEYAIIEDILYILKSEEKTISL